jgi:hypothetical protein
MHALQELPTVPSRPAAAASQRSWRRVLRCVIGVIGGAVWWGAVLRLAICPQAGGPWQSALAAGGWGLGLIPLHAVPVRIRRPRRDGATAA